MSGTPNPAPAGRGAVWTGDATVEELRVQGEIVCLERAEMAAAGLTPEQWYDGEVDDSCEPSGEESWSPSDGELLAATQGRAVHPVDLLLLDSIPVSADDAKDVLLDRLRLLDRVEAWCAAHRADTLVALAGETPSGEYLAEVAVESEVAIARRSSYVAAGRAIENARALATSQSTWLAALRDGLTSEKHVAMLVERTRLVRDDDVAAEIGRRALPAGMRLPVGKFTKRVDALVAELDPDAVARHERAKAERGVWVRPLPDGMASLTLVHEAPVVALVEQTLTADGLVLRQQRRDPRAGDTLAAAHADAVKAEVDVASGRLSDAVNRVADEDQRLAACRADALVTRVLGTIGSDGTVTWDRASVPVHVEVVIDLETLRGEAEHLTLVNGQPTPASTGRDLAGFGTWWRRVVTDPVTGHLLDYGTSTYLPPTLRRHAAKRDDGCRVPVCGTTDPRRLQLDHAQPYPAGPSTTGNTGMLCTTCHQLKTTRHAHVSDSRPDGSATWTTGWGQSVHIPPRPYLRDPERGRPPDPAAPAPPPPDDAADIERPPF